ncbi:putative GATA transcription factor [Xylona heveae TC161]|uniref:Putative GATA transcription factor n=1 Tax=Xylona heveae (strain CBS 132557 / TC161) TaxID=1328760 RepID=A0A165HFB8_XYLHT|nr:putative GATA transcription factor [Xylona heveae TC161]KZF23425.1 putative GATA transcription factor [Xylona heveae TC161]
MTYATSSPAATAAQGNTPPICQNCTTSTTPLWRRDEMGSVLCNACGLFLKLHGRPRPISLKTDVIKSRNRVKSSGQNPKKKSLFESNGLAAARSDAGTPPNNLSGHRRTSQKASSGASDRSNSPISRTATPYHNPNIAPQSMFDGVTLAEHNFHPSPSLPSLNLRQPSPGAGASFGERHLEPPQSYESLLATNTSLKTRVSELEVINDLFRGRVAELEQSEATARRGEMMRRESETHLRHMLDESQVREGDLKRRLDELEAEVMDLRSSGPRTKKMRVSDIVDDENTPIATTTPPPSAS